MRLAHACADMLAARARGSTRRVADLTRLFASYLVEKYTDAARERSELRGGLPSASSPKWKTTSVNGEPRLSTFQVSALQLFHSSLPAAIDFSVLDFQCFQPFRNARARSHKSSAASPALPRRISEVLYSCFAT